MTVAVVILHVLTCSTIIYILGTDRVPYIGTDISHDAIPHSDIILLSEIMNPTGGTKIPFDDAIHVLKRTLYPFDYDPHPWIQGNTYSPSLAMCMFRYW